MSISSRVRYLETSLSHNGFNNALRAMDWLMEEMNAQKGFMRHDGSDYFIHPIDCAQDLFNHNMREEDLMIVALLHDMQEDVPGVTPKLIEDKFSTRSAVAVDLLSKKPDIDYKKRENIIPYAESLLLNSLSIRVKAADRKHNFSTLKDATPEKRLRQAIETEEVYFPLFKRARQLYPRHSSYFYSVKTSIEFPLWLIKEMNGANAN